MKHATDLAFEDMSKSLLNLVEWMEVVLQCDFSAYTEGPDDFGRGCNLLMFVSFELLDGVLLCKLLSTLFAGRPEVAAAAATVDESGTGKAKQDNFRAFGACCQALGVPAEMLFTPEGMETDPESIVPCLLSLRAIAEGGESFHDQLASLQHQHQQHQHEQPPEPVAVSLSEPTQGWLVPSGNSSSGGGMMAPTNPAPAGGALAAAVPGPGPMPRHEPAANPFSSPLSSASPVRSPPAGRTPQLRTPHYYDYASSAHSSSASSSSRIDMMAATTSPAAGGSGAVAVASPVAEHLVSAGILDSAAGSYAQTLFEDGFDTEDLFDELSIDELREDYGFKRGHLKAVERVRGRASAASAATAAGYGGTAAGYGSDSPQQQPPPPPQQQP